MSKYERLAMYYNNQNVKLAKNLRKNMTPWERKLWYCFLKTYSYKFQRQKTIGNYIADFYCAKAKLIVELDGSGHFTSEASKHDMERTKNLDALGFKVIRFDNTDIDKNFYSVCSVIDEEVTRRMQSLEVSVFGKA